MNAQDSLPAWISRWATWGINWLGNHPWATHLGRAGQRFTYRLGNAFAGAITFFSVVSSVPVLMLGFSALGFVLTVLRPDVMQTVRTVVQANLTTGPVRDAVLEYLNIYLFHWQGVGMAGLAIGAWSGAVWMRNFKSAVRAMWRPEFDRLEKKRFWPLEMLINLGMMLALLGLVLMDFALTSLFARWGRGLFSWPPLTGLGGLEWLVRVISALVSIAGGTLILYLVYTVLPQVKAPKRAVWIGSGIAAAVVWGLQTTASQLTVVFSRNRSAAVWGASVIVALLFMNILARVVLFIAAWIATDNQPAVALKWNKFDDPLRNRDDVLAVDGHWEAADKQRDAANAAQAPTASTSR